MTEANKKRSKINVIKLYFGLREGDKASDFMKEIKQLSTEERLDLAQGAAKEMNLVAAECDFKM